MDRRYHLLPLCSVILFWVVPAAADHPGKSGPFPHIAHLEVQGVVTRIEPSMLFVQPEYGLQPRTISILKAERIGLSDAKIGDKLTLVVDEGNVLIDAHSTGRSGQGHRIIAGQLRYADQFWSEIKLSTPEGFDRFEVDSLAGSKLSVLQEGTPVEVELDEANVVIDIHRQR